MTLRAQFRVLPRASIHPHVFRPIWPIWAIVGLLTALSTHAQESRIDSLVSQALALKPNKVSGARLFDELCARCHGPAGEGEASTVTPALAGQLPRYVIKQLADMAEANRSTAEMHRLAARAELIRPQALADIAGHLDSLPRMRRPQLGDGTQLSEGKQIYESQCAQCHGFQAEGDSQNAVPVLQGQHYSYLLMQMRQMPISHGTSLSFETLERFEELKLEELTAVSDYVSRIEVAAQKEEVVNLAGAFGL